MKVIIYTLEGGLRVCRPAEGARLALQIELADGRILTPEPPARAAPVDSFLRRWPVAGAVVQWAESEDEFVSRVRARSVPPDATDVQVVESSAIPADRTFRNAWKAGAGTVEHDMQKCRELHRQRLRALRQPLLAAADVEFMRALEEGRSTTEIVARKQALRDVTADPLIDAAQTPEELKAVIPAALAVEQPALEG